jgi:hypothetical protein
MTLTVLDPRTGHQVTITVPNKPAQPRSTPAEIVRHPSCPSSLPALARRISSSALHDRQPLCADSHPLTRLGNASRAC